MSKRRVILLSFNWANHFSLALGYLQSYALKDQSTPDPAEIEIVDFDTEMLNVQLVVYYLVQFKPDLIGFSCYCWNIGKVLDTARIIKTVYPEIKIVLGGPEAGPIGEKYLRENPFIDFVVKGEGEITFSELLKWLLVDDAMTTVDAMLRRLAAGDTKEQAGTFAYRNLAAPMLAGTLITIASFVPIGFARSSAGEYTFSIFAVVAIALVTSWLVAVIFAPVVAASPS